MIPCPSIFQEERKSKLSAIFDFIRIPFGFVIKWIYGFSGSYLLAIILFAVVLKIVMFPFGIKQQTNSQKQAKLRPKENVIRKKYAGRTDRATQLKMNTEIQELYRKENFSPFGGCLPMIVQMLVLLAVYAVVRTPLTYTAKLPAVDGFDTVEATKKTAIYMVLEDDLALRAEKELAKQNGESIEGFAAEQMPNFLQLKTDYSEEDFWNAHKAGSYNINSEINIIEYLSKEGNAERFVKTFAEQTHYTKNGDAIKVGEGLDASINGETILAALPDLEIGGGFNLGTTPALGFITSSESPVGEKLLLLIPLVTLITSYAGQAITRKFTYQPEQAADAQNQMRTMNIMMPLFSLFIAFQVPAAVGIYWTVQNVLGPVQQIVLSKIFPIPEISPEEMREAERLYGGKVKKKKAPSDGKKKKSLIYDDDDEYESVSIVPEKKVLKEKEQSEKTEKGIEKAPLKED